MHQQMAAISIIVIVSMLIQTNCAIIIANDESEYTLYPRDYIFSLRLLQQDELLWTDANQYCQDTYDSTLATMITQRDFDLAYNISFFGGLIGLNDLDNDGQFSWIDGSPCYMTTDSTVNSSFCSELFRANQRYNTIQKCSRTGYPSGAKYPTDWNCNITYRQWYCNKGMLHDIKKSLL